MLAKSTSVLQILTCIRMHASESKDRLETQITGPTGQEFPFRRSEVELEGLFSRKFPGDIDVVGPRIILLELLH